MTTELKQYKAELKAINKKLRIRKNKPYVYKGCLTMGYTYSIYYSTWFDDYPVAKVSVGSSSRSNPKVLEAIGLTPEEFEKIDKFLHKIVGGN